MNESDRGDPATGAPADVDAVDRRRVVDSWTRIAPVAPLIGPLFYDRLVAEAPDARRMFETDATAQGAKLGDTLAAVADWLAGRAAEPAFHRLVARHRELGVRPEQYPVVCRLLVATLDEALGGGLAPAERAAWSRALAVVSARMLAP